MSTVIQVDNVWKKYQLGVLGTGTLSHDLNRWWHRVRGKPDPYEKIGERSSKIGDKPAPTSISPLPSPPSSESIKLSEDEMWALQGVTFEVKQGEILGIIGRNGAGKSTLLKILSRVTSPTSGEVRVKGRIASLLEVGTGFHPELTGRENIFLNGAILGMTKAEIRGKFDEIIAFAEIEKFIDTPVKRYSSGMYVRLAFAVAAHLEPEILIVDEVLAVGDASFQKKCLGKMGDIAKRGRTILFVSHNMAAINQLTSSCFWLESGMIALLGKTATVVGDYLRGTTLSAVGSETRFDIDPEKDVQVLRACILNQERHVRSRFSCDESVIVELLIAIRRPVRGLYGYMNISRTDGSTVLVSDSHDVPPNRFDVLPPGTYTTKLTVPARTLGHGDYTVYFNFTDNTGLNPRVAGPGYVCSFTLEDFSTHRGNSREGFLGTLIAWDTTRNESDAVGQVQSDLGRQSLAH